MRNVLRLIYDTRFINEKIESKKALLLRIVSSSPVYGLYCSRELFFCQTVMIGRTEEKRRDFKISLYPTQTKSDHVTAG